MYTINKIGNLRPKKSSECKNSKMGIGLEKLDRDLYDPTSIYAPLSEIGVNWVRIQSGWCKTEKQKGVYDFSWLDEIVDSIISHGMTPWLCLCYGNELYTPDADNSTGSVGYAPIRTQEEREAWHNYVVACVSHYKDKISLFEVWNEPDQGCWKPNGPNPKEYGEFCIATAKAVKEANPDAEIAGGALCMYLTFWNDAFKTGMLDYVDFMSYHRYKNDVEVEDARFISALKGLIKSYTNREIGLIQGEAGTQSERSANGTHFGMDWDERKQAKYLLRRMAYDLTSGVYLSSYFTAVDIFENLEDAEISKDKSMYGFFGVIGEKFDENDRATGEYYKKPSYKAFQSLCALFDGNEQKIDLPIYFMSYFCDLTAQNDVFATSDLNGVYTHGFKLGNGLKALLYWKPCNLMTTEFSSTISLVAMGLGEAHVVDFYDGSVYEIAADRIEVKGDAVTLKNLPLRDYPMAVVFGDVTKIM